MPPIGEMLREARMRQRLDIADVEASTKIRAKYLRALENEEWGMLPGSTFVKTFLRTYSEALGLDPHLIVEEYRVNHEEPSEIELQPFTPARAGRDPRRGRPGPPPRGLVLGLIVAGVLAFLIVLGLSGEDDPGEQAAGPSTQTTPKPKAKRRRQQPAAPPKQVVLRIVPDADTYVCLDRGEGTEVLFEDTITAPQSFRGKRLRINLGRRAVQLLSNGKPVTIEQSSDPVGFEFTPGRSRELAEGERPCA